jgi:hypothetical protein
VSVRILGKVLRESEAVYGERLVLIALADSASDDGVTWEPQAGLAAKARLSLSQTEKVVKKLVADGLVELRKAQRGRRRINVYRVMLPGLPEVQYDRLPFDLKEPFGTTPQNEGPSDRDDPSSAPPDDPSSGLAGDKNRQEPTVRVGASPLPSEQVEQARTKPPKLTKNETEQNPGYNALAEVCGIDPRSNRGQAADLVGIGLNGKGRFRGIREFAWDEWREHFGDEFDPDEDGEDFERYVARRIGEKAERYVAAMPRGTMLTPTALRDWWFDIEKIEQRGGGLTPSEIARIGREEEL